MKNPIKTTDRERPLCRFFAMGTCKFGTNCSFSHAISSEELDEGRKQIPCAWFHEKKSCRFGSRCCFSHDVVAVACDSLEITKNNASNNNEEAHPSKNTTTSSNTENEEFNCGVCFESVVQLGKRYGLLSNCEHCFCIDCLREWRSSTLKMKQDIDVTQSCPTCRVKSSVVVASKDFVVGCEKDILLQRYKKKMEEMSCRYFDGSIGSCPFGRGCFYAHVNWDGENLKLNDLRRSY